MWNRRVGSFRIEKRLSNRGATARVYVVTDAPKQRYALKCARTTHQDRYVFQDHIRQEVDILRQLSHPGIVPLTPVIGDNIYAARADTLPGQPLYFVMDYLAGGALGANLRRFDAQARLRLCRRVFEIVLYLHRQGFAHGDLKPEHVLFRTPTDDAPVLIDFGATSPLAEPPPLTASLPYAAPELLRALQDSGGESLRAAQLDTWALGAIFYEIITGRRLVPGRTRHTVMRNGLKGSFDLSPLPASLTPMLDPEPATRPSIIDLEADFARVMPD